MGREEAWWGHYAAFVLEHDGGAPSQLGGVGECRLYKWVHAQRRARREGKLAEEKVAALDRVGQWAGAPRGNLTELWQARLREVEEFRRAKGRFPTYQPQPQGQSQSDGKAQGGLSPSLSPRVGLGVGRGRGCWGSGWAASAPGGGETPSSLYGRTSWMRCLPGGTPDAPGKHRRSISFWV